MDKHKVVRQTLAFINVVGVAIIVVLFSVAMALYVKDPQNYDTHVSAIIIPFDAVCIITVITSVALFELHREDKG